MGGIQGLLLHDPALGMGSEVWAVRRAARDLPTLSYVSDEYDRYGVRRRDMNTVETSRTDCMLMHAEEPHPSHL